MDVSPSDPIVKKQKMVDRPAISTPKTNREGRGIALSRMEGSPEDCCERVLPVDHLKTRSEGSLPPSILAEGKKRRGALRLANHDLQRREATFERGLCELLFSDSIEKPGRRGLKKTWKPRDKKGPRLCRVKFIMLSKPRTGKRCS